MRITDQPSSALTRVLRGNLCAGCGACAGLFPDQISMQTVAPGFLRPLQNMALDSSQESLIARICPGLGQNVAPSAQMNSVLWGPYVSMQTGWASDPALRHAAASGGALSAMLVFLRAAGLVDAVVQTSAAAENVTGNATVITVQAAEILQAAGSRYAPSAPLSGLRVLQSDGRRFCFVGKPCDTAALRALIAIEPDFARVFPVILSFFCAGIPSLSASRAVLTALGTTEPETRAFRYRGMGWPGRATATLQDGSQRSMSYADSWGKILSKQVQHRCKICADGSGIAADIAFADAWQSDAKGYPIFTEADGISLIVARNTLGASLIDQAQEAGYLLTTSFDPETLATLQPGQRERRRALLARLAALCLILRPIPKYAGLQIWAVARQNPFARSLRNFAGTLRRAFQRQI